MEKDIKPESYGPKIKLRNNYFSALVQKKSLENRLKKE